MTIACAHPGKHGDALYSLPAIRALCERHGTKADFYTSAYCAPLRDLFSYQDCINNFYVAPNYVLERMDMGAQPYYVPLDASQYEAVYQMGFRAVPDCPIPEYIARGVGVTAHPIRYDVPDSASWADRLPQEFIVLAPRGETSFTPLFQDVIDKSPLPVVVVGGGGDDAPFDRIWSSATGLSYLETAWLISRARGFVGIMSSQLVLANGFPIPRIAVHDGKSWDMRHVVRSPYNHYPVNPSAEAVLQIIEGVTA